MAFFVGELILNREIVVNRRDDLAADTTHRMQIVRFLENFLVTHQEPLSLRSGRMIKHPVANVSLKRNS